MMTENLIRKARAYALNDDYVVTANLINQLCDALEVQEDNRASLLSYMMDNKENFKHAEMYRHLRNSACHAPHDAMAPAVVLCNGNMSSFEWLDGDMLDKAIEEDMKKDYYCGA